ncbi:MAG: chalcone isomerase family protein [Desulfobulbales bacterium]|nr:chalcone isomerase family protein [Desulfobulbales bacterium]
MKKRFELICAAQAVFFCLAYILMLAVQPVAAREIAGVDIPPTVTIEDNELVLNGAGIRKRFFIKVYVGSLYLTRKRTTVEQVLADPGAKRIAMNFLYKELSPEKLVKAWNEGFTGNNSTEELGRLQERINRFNSFFTTVRKGDEIRLDYLPGEGTRVWHNDTLKGSVAGADFNQALLKIWLGPEPADVGLKDDMLGISY